MASSTESMEFFEWDGWRIAHTDDFKYAIDNKPAVEEAKKKGESSPEFQHVVVPQDLIVEYIDP